MKTRILTIVTLALLLTSVTALADQKLQAVQPGVFITMPTLANQHEAGILTVSPLLSVWFAYDQPGVDTAAIRWIVKPAVLPNGQYCATRVAYENYLSYLLALDEPGWEPWTDWPADGDDAVIQLPTLASHDQQGNRIYYLVAFQVMAEDGTVSSGLQYGQQVGNFAVSEALAPVLAVTHPLLGTWQGSGPNLQGNLDLLPGIDHGFQFAAQAGQYGGELASVRWGWDLADPNDPDDPNWAVPAGLEEENFFTPAITFTSGLHALNVHALDTAGGETRFRLLVDMVPIPDPSDQLPLLLVDDVIDQNSNSWPSSTYVPLDRDEYRDSFWNAALAGSGGVAGFDPEQHVIDTQDTAVDVRDLVAYRAVLWTGRWAASPISAISRLRPGHNQFFGDQLKYNWLAAYQENAGNLLYAGSQAASNFLGEAPYVLPMILDSDQGTPHAGYADLGYGVEARVGFGNDAYGPVYERLYPYRSLGLAAVDVVSPSGAYYSPSGQAMFTQRKKACAGMKGLALDAAFVDSHMGGSAAFADTIWTDADIDWSDDPMPGSGDALAHNYIWGADEFYDVDVVGRDIPVVPQDCDGEACIEPLWRSVSRFDWIQQERLAVDPEDTWPEGYYDDPGEPNLDDYCGYLGLTLDRDDARTNDQISAFVTRKNLDVKPSGAGDVVLGFDPYRFDHEQMSEAIQWVLGQHFGLSMLSRSP